MIVNDGENLSRNCYLIKYKGSIFVVFFKIVLWQIGLLN